MSSIYGIYTGNHGHNCALVKDGEIISVIEEERLTRIKAGENYDTHAELSLEKIQQVTGLDFMDADHRVFVEPVPELWASTKSKNNFEKLSHHDAHCYGAYLTSGFEEKCLSIAYDGGGDRSVIKVFVCENGKMNRVLKADLCEYGSLSHLWGFSTSSINGVDENGAGIWKMCKDEGKLMGMAPEGKFDANIYKMLDNIIKYDNLRFYPSGTRERTKFVCDYLYYLGYFDTLEGKQIYSYNLQKFTEDIFLRFIDDLHKLYPDYRKICFSGGLFANVKLNQKINDLPWVDEIYIFPAMGDEGLALSGCIMKASLLGEWPKPKKLKNLFFGPEYTDSQILEESENYDFSYENYDVEKSAIDLNEGKILGWFQNGSEHGPRALGARSILVRPTDVSTHAELNRRLVRYETMPFAPIVLDEYFDEIFENPKSKYTAEFMTLCFNTKEEWIDKIPAVIQKSDKTARPQLVKKENVPLFWEILDNYRKVSGIPVLLNTSFNSHNEPIIENPKQAFESLKKGIIDKLIIGNYVFSNK